MYFIIVEKGKNYRNREEKKRKGTIPYSYASSILIHDLGMI